mgnify:CR=1 FL=1
MRWDYGAGGGNSPISGCNNVYLMSKQPKSLKRR